MKKTLLLLSFFGLSICATQAQNIRLMDLNGVDVSNTIIYDNVDTASIDPYEYDLNVINSTASNVSINCARIVNNIIPISESYFCWDQCYSSIVDVAQPIAVNAFDTINGFFHAYFNAYHQVGVSTLTFQFYNTANTNDTVNITLVLNSAPAGIRDIGLSAKNKIGAAFPNPASGITSFNYSVESASNTSLQVCDQLGQIVYTKQLESNKGTAILNTSDFNPGVYFYSLVVGTAKVSTNKLIIGQ